MNKKIKVIELFNKIANNEKMPKKIKYGGDILTYQEDVQDYMGISKTGSGSFFNYLIVNNATALFINDQVEILEDEEEIDINDIEELVGNVNVRMNNKTVDAEDLFYTISNIVVSLYNSKDKTNQLVKAVKQLDKKINKEE